MSLHRDCKTSEKTGNRKRNEHMNPCKMCFYSATLTRSACVHVSVNSSNPTPLKSKLHFALRFKFFSHHPLRRKNLCPATRPLCEVVTRWQCDGQVGLSFVFRHADIDPGIDSAGTIHSILASLRFALFFVYLYI